MHVYYGTNLLYDSGLVSSNNHVVVPFGPGVTINTAASLTIIMNQGGNSDTNTLWEYTATVVSEFHASVVFTENTNLAPVPIKFATPPLIPGGTNFDYYCLPEQSLSTLVGQDPYGAWQLEMWDTRAGPTNAAPELTAWQLRFVFQNTAPVPIALRYGTAATNAIPPGWVAPFIVDVPAWATRATNFLVYASGPVNVLFNQNAPPTGTNAGDATLLTAATNEPPP